MNKARKKFVIYATTAVFVLLTLLLSIINIISFSTATEDADRLTDRIAAGQGVIRQNPGEGAPPPEGAEPGIQNPGAERQQGRDRFFDRFSPNSSDLPFSARYFTVKIDKSGKTELVQYNIAAFSEEEATALAEKLASGNQRGWTNVYYRYLVYKDKGSTYVSVVDQSRELVPSYRILLVSAVGEAIGLVVCLFFLIAVSKRIFRPLEEAERKQRAFTAEAEQRFKVPLTVISLNAEILERKNGPDESTLAIRREVRNMTDITKHLARFSIIEGNRPETELCDLSELFSEAAEAARESLNGLGIALKTEIEPGVRLECDSLTMRKVAAELTENVSKFALSTATLSLCNRNNHIVLTVSNDAKLQSGRLDQVFDRFTRLENAEGKPGYGLGLTYVKDVVSGLHGRASAAAEDGTFMLKIIF